MILATVMGGIWLFDCIRFRVACAICVTWTDFMTGVTTVVSQHAISLQGKLGTVNAYVPRDWLKANGPPVTVDARSIARPSDVLENSQAVGGSGPVGDEGGEGAGRQVLG